jgi:hypothetical protein
VMDFGCFVELREFPPGESGRRPEGLVHVSQITNGVLRDPKQAVKRGQRCRVKVCDDNLITVHTTTALLVLVYCMLLLKRGSCSAASCYSMHVISLR